MATDEKCAPHSDFVAVPRWVFDEVLPVNGLPAPFFRVLLFLIRKTLGWQKREDYISLTQIEVGANVARRDAQAGLRFWTGIGVIEVEASGKRRMNKIRLTDTLTAGEIRQRVRGAVSLRCYEHRLVSVGD